MPCGVTELERFLETLYELYTENAIITLQNNNFDCLFDKKKHLFIILTEMET